MCGRFLLSIIPAEYAGLLRIEHVPNLGPDLFAPRFNIAPTQQIIIARNDDRGLGGRQLAAVRWGMIPPWAETVEAFKRPVFNARSETLWEKPMFRESVCSRRCVIPADGFYEWRKPIMPHGRKQPYLIKFSDQSPMFLAGIWSSWRPKGHPEASSIECCAILTTVPNEAMKPIHDRMPVILIGASSLEAWLTPDPVTRADVDDLLRPCPPGALAVSPLEYVGDNRRTKKRPDNESPSLYH